MTELHLKKTIADRANGVIADAYARRMDDANQKVKAFQIGISNLGTSIGSHLLQPVGDAASYVADVLNTLDSRVTIFDRLRIASEGFVSGLGFKDGELVAIAKEWRDFIFGVEDGSKAADQAGQIFKRFREWGDDVGYLTRAISENPIGKFFGDLAPYGLKLVLWGAGITFLAGSIRTLASALFLLSGASALVGAIKTVGSIADVVSGGTFPKGKGPTGRAPSSGAPPVGWWAGAATWFKNLNLATAPGLMSEALSFTPGDTFEEQVAGQRKNREGIERLLGLNKDSNGVSGWNRFWLGAAAEPNFSAKQHFGIGTGGGQSDAVRIDASSIAEMTPPSGTQDVRVTNLPPPNITVHAPITITGVTDPKAAADRVAAQLGEQVRAAREAADTD